MYVCCCVCMCVCVHCILHFINGVCVCVCVCVRASVYVCMEATYYHDSSLETLQPPNPQGYIPDS